MSSRRTRSRITSVCRSLPKKRAAPPVACRETATTKKCTEPVTPSSSFPTDRRRSGCHSENLQPRALRTRCMRTLGRCGGPSRPAKEQLLANCDLFFSHRVELRCAAHALGPIERRKGPAPEGPAADSPSRERFRPPSRQTFRFRVVLLGGLRPTGAPCSAQAEIYDSGRVRTDPQQRNFTQFPHNPALVANR